MRRRPVHRSAALVSVEHVHHTREDALVSTFEANLGALGAEATITIPIGGTMRTVTRVEILNNPCSLS